MVLESTAEVLKFKFTDDVFAHPLLTLACPICGVEEIEQENFGGPDHLAVVVHEDHDNYDSPIGTRGGWVQIQLYCSNGHGFDLVSANHKGTQHLGLVYIGPRDYNWHSAEEGVQD